MSAVQVAGLTVRLGERVLVSDVSFEVSPGEILAVVGESGAGKSVAVRTLLGMAPANASVRADSILVDGLDCTSLTEAAWRGVRGKRIGFVTQDALGALDPLRRIGAEVAEPLHIHTRVSPTEGAAAAEEMLERVAMPDAAERLREYPHQLSGGLRQRALIASALITDPAVLVADEPTTALDATVQARVLALLRELADDGRAVVLVSHDLAAVARVADRIAVMRDGRIIEQGTSRRVIDQPETDYARELWAAAALAQPAAPREHGRLVLAADALTKRFRSRTAVASVSLQAHAGEVIGVVGESGSGKTTLIRLLLGAETPDAGTVQRHGRVQFVSQHPRAAFNPHWSLARSLAEAVAVAGTHRSSRRAAVARLLADVALSEEIGTRRPHEVSGGQLQRVAIARALAAEPDLLILDEPLSALDVTVGQRVLRLLADLRDQRGLGMVLVSHDLGVIASLADRVLVMRAGEVVERGTARDIFRTPRDPFTRELLAAAGLPVGEAAPAAGSDPVPWEDAH